jgi:hypothetical protein
LATNDNDMVLVEPKRNLFGDIEDNQLQFTYMKRDSKKRLLEKIKKYYDTNTHEIKSELHKEIEDCVREQICFNIDLHLNQLKRFISEISAISVERRTEKQIKALSEAQKNKSEYETLMSQANEISITNEKFFLWHTWFSDVLNLPNGNNGFDIIIGNPPYLRIQGIRESDNTFANLLSKNYKSATGSFDLYVTFVEKALDIIKDNGVIYYIMPVKWTNSSFGKGLRDLLSNKSFVSSIINFGAYQVFNASTYTGIHKFKKSALLSYLELDRDLQSKTELDMYLNTITDNDFVDIPYNTENPWTLTNKAVYKVLEKLNKLPYRLSDVFEKIFQGIATSKDDVYFMYDCIKINENEIEGFSKYLQKRVVIENGLIKPLLKGEDVHKYETIQSNRYVIFPYSLEQDNALLYTEQQLKDMFPHGYNYLKACEQELRGREKGRFNNDKWYMFGRGQGINYSGIPKLVAPEISLGGNFTYDINGQYYSTTTIYGYIKKQKINTSYETLLAVMNSDLCWWFLKNTGTVLANGYFRYKPAYLKPFPFPSISKEDDLKIYQLVKRRMDNSNSDYNTDIDIKINKCINKLYGLTDIDENIIQGTK